MSMKQGMYHRLCDDSMGHLDDYTATTWNPNAYDMVHV